MTKPSKEQARTERKESAAFWNLVIRLLSRFVYAAKAYGSVHIVSTLAPGASASVLFESARLFKYINNICRHGR